MTTNGFHHRELQLVNIWSNNPERATILFIPVLIHMQGHNLYQVAPEIINQIWMIWLISELYFDSRIILMWKSLLHISAPDDCWGSLRVLVLEESEVFRNELMMPLFVSDFHLLSFKASVVEQWKTWNSLPFFSFWKQWRVKEPCLIKVRWGLSQQSQWRKSRIYIWTILLDSKTSRIPIHDVFSKFQISSQIYQVYLIISGQWQ